MYSYTTSKFAIDNQMILNFESCYKRSISGRLLGDYVVPIVITKPKAKKQKNHFRNESGFL
jgi:hypothetical protein